MRKTFSILFTILILLNILGYYFVFLGLDYRNDIEITKRFDSQNYSNSETITIKIPLTMPYGGSNDFERVDGEFEHQGELYRLIKQRFANDTLYVVCLKDTIGKRIDQALGNYAKSFSDSAPVDCHSGKTSVGFIKDYMAQQFAIHHVSFGWERDTVNSPSLNVFISDYYPSIIHPPERVS